MKKTFLITVSMMIIESTTVFAQLSVNSYGWTTAKSINVSQNASTINYNPYGITSELSGVLGATTCAIAGYNSGNSSVGLNTVIGLYGFASESFGVNYGVYGCTPYLIPGTCGAAIYGSSNNYYRQLYDLYAGFFDGNVKIMDDLIVNGTITSTILNNALPNNNFQSIGNQRYKDNLSESVIDQISSLQSGSFYVEEPVIEPIIGDAHTLESLVSRSADSLSIPQKEDKPIRRKHYGLSADELEAAFPDLVYENEDGTKSINYVEMVPILVQAIKELKAEIEELKGGNSDMR